MCTLPKCYLNLCWWMFINIKNKPTSITITYVSTVLTITFWALFFYVGGEVYTQETLVSQTKQRVSLFMITYTDIKILMFLDINLLSAGDIYFFTWWLITSRDHKQSQRTSLRRENNSYFFLKFCKNARQLSSSRIFGDTLRFSLSRVAFWGCNLCRSHNTMYSLTVTELAIDPM